MRGPGSLGARKRSSRGGPGHFHGAMRVWPARYTAANPANAIPAVRNDTPLLRYIHPLFAA